jgi:hypothetical protein
VYIERKPIILGRESEYGRGHGRQHEVTLEHSEIGEAVLAALRGRCETMKRQLRELGVEWTEDEPEVNAAKRNKPVIA